MQSAVGLTSDDKARLTKQLQDGIATNRLAILDMQRQLNSLAPTAVLPPELLVEIFIHTAASAGTSSGVSFLPRFQSAYGNRGQYAWLTVTHVCHHWREVALSAPRLWSTISAPRRMDFLEEIILRSKQAPLTVWLNGYVPLDCMQLVMRELPRIAKFHARIDFGTQKGEYSQSAPKLKELVLKTDMYETQAFRPLYDHFVACDLPKLERLELFPPNDHVLWSSKLLKPTLRHLTLHPTLQNSSTSMDEIVRVLGTLPLLETLSLSSCLPTTPAHMASPPTHIVHFPNLRKLCIVASSLACKAFFQRISFPGNTSRVFNMSYGSGVESALETVLGASPRRSDEDDDGENTRFPVIRSVHLSHFSHTHSLQLRAWSARYSLQEMHAGPETLPEPLLDIVLESPCSITLFKLLQYIPTAGIEALLVSSSSAWISPRMGKTEWQGMAERLPVLRELELGEFANDHVHQLLDHRIPCEQEPPATDGKRSRRKKQPCMPHLEVLHINLACGKGISLDRLEKSLVARKRAKIGLKALTVYGCSHLTEADITEFKKCVGKVELKRKTMEEYTEDEDDDEYDDSDDDRYTFFEDDFPFPFGGLWDDHFM